jgi:hypothetical protein
MWRRVIFYAAANLMGINGSLHRPLFAHSGPSPQLTRPFRARSGVVNGMMYEPMESQSSILLLIHIGNIVINSPTTEA